MANQLPGPGEVFLDHTAFFVSAMDAAADALEHCGFRLTPFTAQTNREGGATVLSGTGNRCTMFRNGYLEILTATSDTPLSAQLRERIADHAGLHLAAFTSADTASEHRRLAEAGFEILPLVDMRRPVGNDFARFTIARVAHGTMPEGRAQFLTHHTEPLVWLPDMLDHPNGATALTGLWIAADDPAEPATRYARFTGRPAAQHGGTTTIELDRGALNFATPAYLKDALGIVPAGKLPCLVAASIAVESLERLEAFLARSGIAYRRIASGIAVTLPPAVGDTLLFHEGERSAVIGSNCVFFIPRRPEAISNLYGDRILYSRGVKQPRLFEMTDFAPLRVCPPHHFDIRHDRRGHWIARDRDGLTGGTFLTHRDAVRFAPFETGGNASYVHDRKGGFLRGPRP